LNLRPSCFRGDIHLSDEERRWKSTIHEMAGIDLPFWIVNAGGKFDFTIKWWDARRYQQVIDHFRDRVLFVQVGELGHYHPPLKNVVDLRGKTDLRQLVRLVYHSQGVLCGVTALMHLAAAVPTRPDRPPSRPAVIIAGGREPTHWEAYPHHQFIHTIGALPCCANGGCWRARTQALGDGEESDRPENLCHNVVRNLPRCMDMITAEEVIRRIETYFDGACANYLETHQRRAARRAIARSIEGPRFESTINLATAPAQLASAARQARSSRVPRMSGRGILLILNCASELIPAIAAVRVVRKLGSKLPVECWLNNRCPGGATKELRRLGATLHRISPQSRRENDRPTRAQLRLHALTKTSLHQVLMMDAGTIPVVSPDALFAREDFMTSGVLFARARKCQARPGVWKMCGMEMPRYTASGAVMLFERRRCWPGLQLWRWIIERFYFFSGYVDGEGGAAQLAFEKLNLRAPISLSLEKSFWSAQGNLPPPSMAARELRMAESLLRTE
jgi:hypothetical protein